MRKVLIAHQSSIPHYRVDFYNYLSEITHEEIEFSVVRDRSERKNRIFFKEQFDEANVKFKIHHTDTFFFSKKNKYCFQTFIFNAWKYDLIIAENAINNLSYPLLILYKYLFNKKIAFWGHGRDLNNPEDLSRKKIFFENFKLLLIKSSDGFFAYTNSVKDFLVSKKIQENKIHTLNNTININKARKSFNAKSSKHHSLSKHLVFTGRLTKSKRIEFLLKSFKELYHLDNEFTLSVIGDGELDKAVELSKNFPVTFHGEIIDNVKLAEIYTNCDLYVFPGFVGLGIVHAMCFNLVPVVIRSEFHKPEYDYLVEENSYILPEGIDEKAYADYIFSLYKNPERILEKKGTVWDTISHLTIENMAINFNRGMKMILG